MNKQIQRNFIWFSLGNVIYLGCQWLITVITPHMAGYDNAGVLSLAMSVSASFQNIALFGIRNFQVSDINSKYSDSCYVCFRNVTCILAMILCMAFAFVNGYNGQVLSATALFMMFRLSENYSDVFHGILQKNDKLYIAGQSLLVRGIVILAGFAAGMLITGSLTVGLGTMTVMAIFVTAFVDHMQAKKISDFHPFEDLDKCMSLGRETWALCVYMFLNSVIATAPKYILEKMSGEEILGIYSSIFAPALLIQAAAQYLYIPFISKFASLFDNKNIKEFKRLADRIVIMIAMIGLLAAIGSVLAGKWVLALLLTDTILPYSNWLFLIVVGIFCTAINAFYQSISVVLRLMKMLVISSAIGCVACCITSAAAIARFSADGASIGLIGGTLSATVILYAAVNKKLKMEETA